MPNLHWTQLSHLQIGTCGEYYAKIEFISYGYEVYAPEIDDHGVDFIVKARGSNTYYEVQVKSCANSQYIFISKDKMVLETNRMVCIVLLSDDSLPKMYLIQAKEWERENDLLKDKNYDGLKSKPEWGINISKKNMKLLEEYRFEKVLLGL